MKNKNYYIATIILGIFAFSYVAFAQMPRERISFNESWRFQKDDAAGAEGKLAYEKTKDWIRSTGNEFVLTSDAAKSERPSGNLGEDVSYTQKSFDDSAWRTLNLPHDWAIEGDFIKELPGETGKRNFAGIGWYRKHFTVSKEDKNKVTITFGDKSDATARTVKAELRRLMLENVETAKGKFATESFIVNIRIPQISTEGGEVKRP